MKSQKKWVLGVTLSVGALLIYQWGLTNGQDPNSTGLMEAANASSDPAARELDVYYPGTEKVAPDEMRIVALGTGQPSSRPKQRAELRKDRM